MFEAGKYIRVSTVFYLGSDRSRVGPTSTRIVVGKLMGPNREEAELKYHLYHIPRCSTRPRSGPIPLITDIHLAVVHDIILSLSRPSNSSRIRHPSREKGPVFSVV